jgi:alpha-N-acetylglucosamine transferase
MMFTRLRELDVHADLVLLQTERLNLDAAARPLLERLAAELEVTHRVSSVAIADVGWAMYADSGLKLALFSLTEYDRLIYLDSDGLVRRNLDHLFLLPETDLALPRAYWIDQPWYTSILLVVTPSARMADRVRAMLSDPRYIHAADMCVRAPSSPGSL